MKVTGIVGRRWKIAATVGVATAAAVWLVANRVTLSALEGPGSVETWAATRAKHWLIHRAASEDRAVSSPDLAVAIGEMRFRGQCAPCHGSDGRSPTEIGRGLYPRAVDLGSQGVQSWSDRELFWITKHGIRFTGMPAFGSLLEDDEIAALVAYVRSVGRPVTPGQ